MTRVGRVERMKDPLMIFHACATRSGLYGRALPWVICNQRGRHTLVLFRTLKRSSSLRDGRFLRRAWSRCCTDADMNTRVALARSRIPLLPLPQQSHRASSSHTASPPEHLLRSRHPDHRLVLTVTTLRSRAKGQTSFQRRKLVQMQPKRAPSAATVPTTMCLLGHSARRFSSWPPLIAHPTDGEVRPPEPAA